MCVRAIWQSRAGGPPLREIEGGDGVNIRRAYVWASYCSPGRRSQPGVLSITRFPDWTEPDVLQIARQGCQGLIVTINPAGSRVWLGPGARRKCRGLTSWCASPVRTSMIAQHAQAWKQCFGSRPRSHGRPMPAGGRICEPGEGPRVVLGALNPMDRFAYVSHGYLLSAAMQWHTPGFAQHFCAWTTRTSLAAAFSSDATPASTLPSRSRMSRGGVGGYQVSIYQNPNPPGGRWSSLVRANQGTVAAITTWLGLWFPERHMSRNKTCGPASGCRRDGDGCVCLRL
jgi:hypothetical protein